MFKKLSMAAAGLITSGLAVLGMAGTASADATNCSTWYPQSNTAAAQCTSSFPGGAHPLNQVSVKLICWNGPYRWTGFGPYVNVGAISNVTCPSGWAPLTKSYVLR